MSENETQHKTLLGLTARWTAAARAMESKREDRLFNDPWAVALAGEDGGSWIEGLPVEENRAITTILRTRFFDDFLLRVANEHKIRQIVIIAAGLDTRAYRLAWPEQTRLFELDQPQVLEYKEQILTSAGAKPSCERRAIAVDLTGPWTKVLRGAGFDPQQPTVWLLEGILMYLPTESGIRILDDATAQSASGSWIGFDAVNSEFLTSRTHIVIEAMERAGVPWQNAMDDPQGLLAEHGWRATVAQKGEDSLNFGRFPHPVLPPEVPGIPRYWMVTGQRQ